MVENDDKQKRKLYFDELVIILVDVIDKSPDFFYLDLQVFGLLGMRGLESHEMSKLFAHWLFETT